MPADSILHVGFLSPHVVHYIAEHRKQNAEMFSFAEELNRIGQRTLAESPVTVNEQGLEDPKLIAFLLLIRTLSNFQGALLLAERGMVVEAKTLARSCYENAYILAAIQKDGAEIVRSMISDDQHARKGQARWMLDDPARLDYAPGGVEQMKKTIEEIEATGKTVGLNFDQITKRAGIPDFYIWYKTLSWDSAHPTIQALSRYLDEETGKSSTLSWGPAGKPNEVGDAVNVLLPAVFGAVMISAELLGSKQAHLDVSALWHRYKRVVAPDEERGPEPPRSAPRR